MTPPLMTTQEANPRTPIRHRSKKKARELRAFNKAVPAPKGLLCQARFSPYCTKIATDRHHIVPQSQGGPDTLDNIYFVCRACHDRIKARPEEARALGLLKSNPTKILPSPLMKMEVQQ